MNFNFLKLKKLIATCYSGSPVMGKELPLFDRLNGRRAFKIEITEVKDETGNGTTGLSDVEVLLKNDKNVLTVLEGNGDFRSRECVELLKQADIVVTNPPFSLFREYVVQLIEYKKEFIIIGHQNAITYKEIFRLIKENRLWLGYGFKGGAAFFIANYEDYASATSHQQGCIRVSGVVWFTNIETTKRHEELILYKKYSSDEYPKYDNYEAINVDKTNEIPMDYDGVMGVPITFLDKYNPDQFEIVELGIVGSCNFTCNKKMEILDKNGNSTGKCTFNAKGTLYKKYNPERDKKPAFKNAETGELYSSIYARILIQKRKKQ